MHGVTMCMTAQGSQDIEYVPSEVTSVIERPIFGENEEATRRFWVLQAGREHKLIREPWRGHSRIVIKIDTAQ